MQDAFTCMFCTFPLLNRLLTIDHIDNWKGLYKLPCWSKRSSRSVHRSHGLHAYALLLHDGFHSIHLRFFRTSTLLKITPRRREFSKEFSSCNFLTLAPKELLLQASPFSLGKERPRRSTLGVLSRHLPLSPVVRHLTWSWMMVETWQILFTRSTRSISKVSNRSMIS